MILSTFSFPNHEIKNKIELYLMKLKTEKKTLKI